jgi:aminopeptidase N
LICAFGAEEIGLVGSAHLAAKPPVPREAIDAMVNLDAVGRLGDGPLHVAGLESSAAFADLVAAAVGDVPVAVQGVGLANSDHVSFLAHAIPALFLFTGAYPEMNSPADSLAAIDLRGLVRVAGVTARLVAELAAHDGPLPFIANETAKIAPAVVAGDRRTWFGSVPDFAAVDSEGYRIGGLAADGPAARAGLRVGDRLLSLAGEPVSDLASFTTALRRHAPGEVVDVKIEREGRTFTFLVTLGDRADRLQ